MFLDYFENVTLFLELIFISDIWQGTKYASCNNHSSLFFVKTKELFRKTRA